MADVNIGDEMSTFPVVGYYVCVTQNADDGSCYLGIGFNLGGGMQTPPFNIPLGSVEGMLADIRKCHATALKTQAQRN